MMLCVCLACIFSVESGQHLSSEHGHSSSIQQLCSIVAMHPMQETIMAPCLKATLSTTTATTGGSGASAMGARSLHSFWSQPVYDLCHDDSANVQPVRTRESWRLPQSRRKGALGTPSLLAKHTTYVWVQDCKVATACRYRHRLVACVQAAHTCIRLPMLRLQI